MKKKGPNGGVMKAGLSKLLKFIFVGSGDDIVSLLKEDYLREKALTEHLRAHATSMPYDFYREQLMKLAALSEEGANILGKKIMAMGGALPEITDTEPTEGTLWEKLARDVEEQNRLYYRYLSQAEANTDEELRGTLTRLRRDKDEQSATIQRLLSGLDGYSI